MALHRALAVVGWVLVAAAILATMAASVQFATLFVPHTNASPDAYLKAITDTRTTFIQGILGFAVFASAIAGYLNLWQSRRSHRESLAVQERGQVTDRFTTAIGLLSDTRLEARLGGIYALEQIARDAGDEPVLYRSVVALLTAFVREHAHRPDQGTLWLESGRPTADVEAIMGALARRAVERDDRPLDLSRTDLRALSLRGIDLEGADLRGASLRLADLGGADLSHSNLSGADLCGTNLDGARLVGADLTNVQMNQDTSLIGADARRARLNGLYAGGASLDDLVRE